MIWYESYFLDSEVLSESVVEFFHGDLAISVLIELSQQGVLFVLGAEDIHGSESSDEFCHVHESVIIFVEAFHEVDSVLLEVSKLGTSLFDFLDDAVNGSRWEDLGVVFHVLLGVLVSLNKLEFKTNKEEGLSNEEVLLSVVLASNWAGLLLSLHEGSSDSSGVLVTDFVDLDGVVSTEERDDETSVLIIGLS